jgi:hypothetical protein
MSKIIRPQDELCLKELDAELNKKLYSTTYNNSFKTLLPYDEYYTTKRENRKLNRSNSNVVVKS